VIALASVALAAPVRFDRVDLLSETPGTWLVYEAPRIEAAPGTVALRWAAQVAPVVSIGRAEISASFAGQSLGVAIPLDRARPATLDVAIVGRALLPIGARAGLAWRAGRTRLGLSVVALSDATWTRADWSSWTVLPAVGVGVGRYRAPGAPWMR
jgi:hypothetical protein